MQQFWSMLAQQISQETGEDFHITKNVPVAGGCINQAALIEGMLGGYKVRYFVKTNHPQRRQMFAAEACGLKAIAKAAVIRVPEPICYGAIADKSYIVMEALNLASGMPGKSGQRLLAQQLAAMHATVSDQFGWQMDNTIGSTPQINTPGSDWLTFWREHRLGFQLDLARQNGYGGQLQSLGERLLSDMPMLLAGREVQASMLHGDLWGGNVAVLSDGAPVIFDPAFYYGDYEAELAMTELFGGFSADFYAAYHEIRPEETGYPLRRTFYNSYHIINHLNMFGGGYHGQAIHMLEQVLSEI